jgi:nucleotide-binding universal stress UspA family protein
VELGVTLLHVGGDQLDVPPVQRPQRDGWSFSERIEAGDVVDTILAVSKDCDADLIAMATQGHDGFLDALRGSNTERVLRQSKCPVLSVPGFSY